MAWVGGIAALACIRQLEPGPQHFLDRAANLLWDDEPSRIPVDRVSLVRHVGNADVRLL
jgi:hypothetical protein